MGTVTIREAKAKLSALIEQSLQGEEVIIARRNRPLVRLVPIGTSWVEPRELGTARGRVVIADDFDATPEDFVDYQG